MIKGIQILFLVLIANSLSAQDNSDSFVKCIIATNTGNHLGTCGESEVVKLVLNDSTFIPFNEFSTFESRLNLQKASVKLEKGLYRIVLINKANEILEEHLINTDSIDHSHSIIVDFDLERCCQNETGKYLFFKLDSIEIVNKKCDNLESTIALALRNNKKLIITGVARDSSDYNIAKERIEYVKGLLVQHGVLLNRMKIEILVGLKKYPLWGSSYNMYPGKDDCLFYEKCEIGIVIEQDK